MTKRMVAWIVAIAVAAALAVSIRLSAQEQEEDSRYPHKAVFTTFDAPGAGAGTQGTFPLAMNPSGAITGYYFDASGAFHGFLRGAAK